MSLTALYCMCVAEGYTTMYIFFNTIFGNTICQTWSKQLENEGIGNCLWGGGGGSSILAHLAKGNVSFCHHLASVVC